MTKPRTNQRKIAKHSKATFIHDVQNILKNHESDTVKVWQITKALADHKTRTGTTKIKVEVADTEERSESWDLIEKLIPMILMAEIIGEDVDPKALGHPTAAKLLGAIITDILVDVPSHQAESVMRRSIKISDEIVKKFSDGMRSSTGSHAKMGLVAFHVMKGLIEGGQYVLVEGGLFDRVLDELFRDGSKMDVLHNIEAVDESAIKMSGRILKHLNEKGYYNG